MAQIRGGKASGPRRRQAESSSVLLMVSSASRWLLMRIATYVPLGDGCHGGGMKFYPSGTAI